MRKLVEVKGELIRQARERAAWTQEELSERSCLGVRTLRRLEAGQASWETIQRVAEALALEPEELVRQQAQPAYLPFDLVKITISSDLCPILEEMIPRVGSVRRHLSQEMGIALPPVRFSDDMRLASNTYQIWLREMVAGEGVVYPGELLAVGVEYTGFEGREVRDPTYNMPGRWIGPQDREPAKSAGLLVFDPLSVIMTHLTYLVRTNAARLLGVDEVSHLLELMGRPRLVEELIPARLSLGKLRSVLRALLEEQVPIRDLGLILETLLDHEGEELPDLVGAVRLSLADLICREYTNSEGEICAVVVRDDSPDWELVSKQMDDLAERGLQPLVVVPDHLRWRARELGGVALSESEVKGRKLRATGAT